MYLKRQLHGERPLMVIASKQDWKMTQFINIWYILYAHRFFLNKKAIILVLNFGLEMDQYEAVTVSSMLNPVENVHKLKIIDRLLE